MRRVAPRPVAFALESLTDSLAPPTVLAAVQRAWPAAAGAFAAHAQPVSERDGVVVVACESAVWAQELDLLSERVVERAQRRARPPGRAAPAPARHRLLTFLTFPALLIRARVLMRKSILLN